MNHSLVLYQVMIRHDHMPSAVVPAHIKSPSALWTLCTAGILNQVQVGLIISVKLRFTIEYAINMSDKPNEIL